MKKIIILTLLFIPSLRSIAQTKYQKDFAELWNDFNNNYAYFDRQKIDWEKVKRIYQPIVDTVKSDQNFIKFLENVFNEFYNGHVSLNVNLASSNKIIPGGSDMWVKKQGNVFILKDVRPNSLAEKCGLKPGMTLIRFNDKSIQEQTIQFLPKSTNEHNPLMYDYAINMLFAGTHDKPRKITVFESGFEKDYYPEKIADKTSAEQTQLVEYKVLPKNTGYIKVNNSLGNYALIKAFDTAIDSLLNTQAIILDLTETPNGGNTIVARAIMGRFIEKEMPYQKHVLVSEEKEFGIKRSWVEYVSPRNTIYKKKLIIMVGHWTGSMGEGIAIGFDGMKRAEVVGTRMAGLLGSVTNFQLTETKISYSIPTEKLFHINGTPREDFISPILTENHNQTLEKAFKLAIPIK